jgi:hypothetical protein
VNLDSEGTRPRKGISLGGESFGGRLGGSSFGGETSFGGTSGKLSFTGRSWVGRSTGKGSSFEKIGLTSSDTGRIDGIIGSNAGILNRNGSFKFDTVGSAEAWLALSGKLFSLGPSLAGMQVAQRLVPSFKRSLGTSFKLP